MNRLFITIFFLVITIFSVSSQDDIKITQYWSIPSYINPSCLTEDNMMNIGVLGRKQDIGADISPNIYILAANMPFHLFNKDQSAGILITSNKLGSYKSNGMSIQYSYNLRINESFLNLGVRAGVLNETYDNTKDKENLEDNISAINKQTKSFIGAIGINYRNKGFYANISAADLFASELKLNDTVSIKTKPDYYLIAGYNISFKSSLFELKPSFLIQNNGLEWIGNTTLRIDFKKLFYVGASYRFKESVDFLAGVNIKGFKIGYSYDMIINNAPNGGRGSHELFVSYHKKIDLGKKKNGNYKSIRIL